MQGSANPAFEVERLDRQNRRQLIGVIALGALATASRALGQSPQTSMAEIPGSPANRTRTSLHYRVDYKASPERIYSILLDAKLFAACTGLPAEIDPKPGGAFSLFSGQIVGRNVELIPNRRLVQAWRPTHWDEGVYSIVRFELTPRSNESTLVLDHTGFPEGEFDHLNAGWHEHYLDALTKFLA